LEPERALGSTGKPGHLNVVGYRSKSKMEAGRKEEQKRAGCAEANKEQVLLMVL